MIDELLAPIDDTSPAGADLRLLDGDVTFENLRSQLAAGPQQDSDEAGEPDLKGVIDLCESALKTKSKDLELIAQLCAAWARVEGMPGLERGLELTQKSLEQFWPGMHPGANPPDEPPELDLRASWLNWMDSPRGLVAAVKQMRLDPQDGSTQRLSWLDHENAAMFDDPTVPAERQEELRAAGVMDAAAWEAGVGTIPEPHLRALVDSLARCRDLIAQIVDFTRRAYDGSDEPAPDLYNLSLVVEAMESYFAERVGGDETQVEPEQETQEGGEPEEKRGARGGSGPIDSRPEALRRLREVGDFFRRTEPHSPVSYLITRAVRWGSMPLDELLKDVVRDDRVIDRIWETLGLDKAGDGDDERDREDD